ncbi:hypothetical protein CK228_16340 [Mesorhizobium sp. WSM4312]|nr:hypothetical protein CK228_16340 [Mesorhizobium sp. WSM4312]
MNAEEPAVSRGCFDATVFSVGFGNETRSGRVWIFYNLMQKMEVGLRSEALLQLGQSNGTVPDLEVLARDG